MPTFTQPTSPPGPVPCSFVALQGLLSLLPWPVTEWKSLYFSHYLLLFALWPGAPWKFLKPQLQHLWNGHLPLLLAIPGRPRQGFWEGGPCLWTSWALMSIGPWYKPWASFAGLLKVLDSSISFFKQWPKLRLKNWCFQIVELKIPESPLDSKEIKPVSLTGNQPWIFIGRTDDEAEAPILWPPDAKSRLIVKDHGAEKDWSQEEKGTTENEMVGWHHWAWVWANSGRWQRTGKPSMLQSVGLQRVEHNLMTEQYSAM